MKQISYLESFFSHQDAVMHFETQLCYLEGWDLKEAEVKFLNPAWRVSIVAESTEKFDYV